MALDSGVKLRYFTTVVSPKVDNGKIDGVFVHSKDGLQFIKARTIVDATGDADVAFRSGCPVLKGRPEDGLMSPVTLICIMQDVDSHQFEKYCRETGDVRFKEKIAKLKKQGRWPFPFDTINCCEMVKRGEFFINTLQIRNIDGTSSKDLTHGIIESRKQIVELVSLIKEIVPGFANARMTQTGPMIGIRDTRRIVGQYQVNEEDILSGEGFNDTVALSGYEWDMADPKEPSNQNMDGIEITSQYAEVPYRSLVPKEIGNIIVAGRSVSCSWEVLGLFRIMPVCFATGQAAGTAAAIASDENISFVELDVNVLQDKLRNNRAILSG
jgi:hypothetical protein